MGLMFIVGVIDCAAALKERLRSAERDSVRQTVTARLGTKGWR